MKYLLLTFFIISFSSSIIKNQSSRRYFVVWNVGQGQWTSLLNPTSCHHFDVGGEFAPFKKIKFWCADRGNEIFLSHWDWDHIGLLKKWKPQDRCLRVAPLGNSSKSKEEIIRNIPACKAPSTLAFSKFTPSSHYKLPSNEQSHVILLPTILLPGDSTEKMESQWLQSDWSFSKVHFLILGHHGSKTSTSEDLLKKLSSLKMAVASARWRRYRHPHPQTIVRLQNHRIPLLRTEDWGNIFFELPPEGAK